MRFLLAVGLCLLGTLRVGSAQGTINLVSPVDGTEIRLLPECQRKVLSLPTYGERLEYVRRKPEGTWRESVPLRLVWRATSDVKGPWRVRIGKTAELQGAREEWIDERKYKPDASGLFTYELERANLDIGTTYYWRVDGNVHCPKGRCSRDCKCCRHRTEVASGLASFKTEDLAPRWIALEGRVGNVRDLGGRLTEDGNRVRTGLVFRGQGLNDASVTGAVPGRNRLMAEDIRYLKETLGIKLDVDLRNSQETAGMTESPLGPDVRLVNCSAPCYTALFTAAGKAPIARIFRLFCDPANYPIYFHCLSGADRTGALAYLLNGVLGVGRQGLETDWESTFYPSRLPEQRKDYSGTGYWCREQHFTDGFAEYGEAGDPWRRRIELYLLDCGITQEEIDAFRRIMLAR